MPIGIDFIVASEPIREPIPKLGGQPNWLGVPQWPLSRDQGTPMWFIGQFPMPSETNRRGALAYIFMTDAALGTDYAAEPEGGENAVIVQPGGQLPAVQRSYRDIPTQIRTVPAAEGPTIGPDHALVARSHGVQDHELQFLGGAPLWLQGPEPPGPDWHLVVQLDSTRLPLQVNFGDAGVGYAFVDSHGLEGRFLWQCH